MSLHLFSHLRTSRAYRALAVTALLSGVVCALSATPAGAQPTPTTISTALFDGTNVGPNLTDPPGTAVSDTATFAGGTGAGATGSVTYSVYSDSACTVLVGSPDTEIDHHARRPASLGDRHHQHAGDLLRAGELQR